MPRPLHILLEKKAILLKGIASKKGYSARDYAPKVLLCSNYASIFLGSKYSNMINNTFYRPSRVRLTQHYLILKTNISNNL